MAHGPDMAHIMRPLVLAPHGTSLEPPPRTSLHAATISGCSKTMLQVVPAPIQDLCCM